MTLSRSLLLSCACLGLAGSTSAAFTAGPVTCQTTPDATDVTFTCTATATPGQYIAVGFGATAGFHAGADGVAGYLANAATTTVDGLGGDNPKSFTPDANQADVTAGTVTEAGGTTTFTFKRKITPADPADVPFTNAPISVWGTVGTVNGAAIGGHGAYGTTTTNLLQAPGGGGGGGGVRPPAPQGGWDDSFSNGNIKISWARETPDQNTANVLFEVECQSIYWCAIGWTNKLAHDSADSVILHSGNKAVDSVAPTGNALVQHKGDAVNNIVLEYGEIVGTTSYYRFKRPTASGDGVEDVALTFGTQKLVYGIGNDVPTGDGEQITYQGHAATAAGRGTVEEINFLAGPAAGFDAATYALIGLGGAAFLGGTAYLFGGKVAPQQMQQVGAGFNRMTQQFIAAPMQNFGTRMSTAFRSPPPPPAMGGGMGGMPPGPTMDMGGSFNNNMGGGGMSPMGGGGMSPMGGSFNNNMGGGMSPMGGGGMSPMGGSFNNNMGGAGPAAPPRNNGWKSAVDPNSGQVYYYNKMLGETSWTAPPGFNI